MQKIVTALPFDLRKVLKAVKTLWVSALKARNVKAQGNALGEVYQSFIRSAEGAK